MIKRSPFTEITTDAAPVNPQNLDVAVSGVAWRFGAFTVKATFNHIGGRQFYAVQWWKPDATPANMHRSHPLEVTEETDEGNELSLTVHGFEPGSQWVFRLVANPQYIPGEK